MKRNQVIRGVAILLGVVCLSLATTVARAEDEPDQGTAQAAREELSQVRERAESMPIDARRETDKRIAVTIGRVNNEASNRGQATVASRLAREFKTTVESLLDQKSEFGWSWGDLLIAQTLLANSGVTVSARDLSDLRGRGLSWGAIAFGLQFHLEDFEDIVKAEGHVAMGLSKSGEKASATGK